MNKQTEAMKMALEFIEYHSMYWNGTGSHPQSIVTALREALDEPSQLADANLVQEPVAYSVTCDGEHPGNVFGQKASAEAKMRSLNESWPEHSRSVVPLYTAPPRREWVSLTDDELCCLPMFDYDEPQVLAERKFARAIESKLKEKNCGS